MGEGSEDFLHRVLAAAHDERLALEHPAGAKAAERATALVVFESFRRMAEQVGFGEFKFSGVRVHGNMVLRPGMWETLFYEGRG